MDSQNSVVISQGETGPNSPAAPTTETSNDRPAWLPENFETPEDLAKSYKELQAKFTQGQQQQPAAAPADDTMQVSNPDGEADDDDGEGSSFEDYITEALSGEGLTEDDYAALAEAGYDRNVVDRYVDGVTASATAAESAAVDTVGGKENYAALVQWASASLAEADIDGFNAVAERGNPAEIRLAVQGLQAQYVKANGSVPSVDLGGRPAPAGASGFESWAQVTTAMRDSRYANDPAYRSEVERKLAASKTLA